MDIKGYVWQTHSQHHIELGKAESISSKIWNQRQLLSPFVFIIIPEILARSIKQEKEIKDIQIEKEEVKLSQYVADMILYRQKLEDSTNQLPEIINELSKLARYKMNIQKSTAFFIFQ